MNQDHRQQIYTLLAEGRALGKTPEAVARMEEAVRQADAHNDPELGFHARNELMDTAVYHGDYDKLMVAYSWCLALVDQEGDTGDSYRSVNLLWKYKWVLEHLVHYPRISRTQIAATLDDFRSRCAKAGFNERPALFLEWTLALFMGDIEAARLGHDRWRLTTRDFLADCEACELHKVAELRVALGDHESAVETAAPILNGRLKCGEIPHLTYATLLRSQWLLGRAAEAEDHHAKGYRLVRRNRDFIREQAWHLDHLVRSSQMPAALALVRRHLPWALETHNLDYQFHFLLAVRSMIRQLVAEGIRTIRISLPPATFPFAKQTTAATAELNIWLEERIAELAAEFDARNGNNYFGTLASSSALPDPP